MPSGQKGVCKKLSEDDAKAINATAVCLELSLNFDQVSTARRSSSGLY